MDTTGEEDSVFCACSKVNMSLYRRDDSLDHIFTVWPPNLHNPIIFIHVYDFASFCFPFIFQKVIKLCFTMPLIKIKIKTQLFCLYIFHEEMVEL